MIKLSNGALNVSFVDRRTEFNRNNFDELHFIDVFPIKSFDTSVYAALDVLNVSCYNNRPGSKDSMIIDD